PGELIIETLVEVLADRHEFFFGRQHEPLAHFRRPPLDAPAPDIECKCCSKHAAENGRDITGPIRHRSISNARPQASFPLSRRERGSGGEDARLVSLRSAPFVCPAAASLPDQPQLPAGGQHLSLRREVGILDWAAARL